MEPEQPDTMTLEQAVKILEEEFGPGELERMRRVSTNAISPWTKEQFDAYSEALGDEPEVCGPSDMDEFLDNEVLDDDPDPEDVEPDPEGAK